MTETYQPAGLKLEPVFEPDWSRMQDATDENPFMHAGVELLKSAGMLLAGVIVTGSQSGPLSIAVAIRYGLLVRANKLCLDLLADVCNGPGRQQAGLVRQLTETLANLIYLCGDDEQGSRHRAFLHDSLISEREFLKVITQRQASDGGTVLPIEERLRRSIEDTARAAGIDLGTIPGRRQIDWPSAQDRIAQAFGPQAYPSYRVGSDALHGGWFDLIRNHLCEMDGGFTVNFDTLQPRPQPLLLAARLVGEVLLTFLSEQGSAEHQRYTEHLAALTGRALRADELHERWLSAR